MSPIDETIFRRKGEQLQQYVQYLTEYKNMPADDFLSDHHNFGLAEHYLEHAIELVLDIARSVVAGLEKPMPDEARELFNILVEADVVPSSFAKEHQAMVGLRNRLVHEYATVDHERVYQYLQEHLDVFSEFLRHVQEYFSRKS
ncbi:MAG TPA: DUF86 domain-containing protein [Candidatus Andersenbacteria bacterium]|nr:DUF86 domain-containing protein [Candidatus Andersenbacteria bacterium]